jgi:NADH:ubiquinone oxidoreductase subunit E
MIIPALLEVQSHFEFVSAETTREIGEALGVSLADITGVIEFNSMLYDHRIARNSTDFTTWLRSILGCSIQMGEFLS